MKNGFIKVATLTPQIRVADPAYNAAECARLACLAAEKGATVAVFPELCLTGYTCGDLFTHRKLIDGALDALRTFIAATAEYETVSVVGLPVAHADKLYNCAAVCQGGMLLGLVPKTYLPSYAEGQELRYFTPAPDANLTYELDGSYVQMGTKQIFVSTTMPDLRFGVEICEDLYAPIPPSTYAAMAGATVICNLSASIEVVGKAAKRRDAVVGQSTRTCTGYVYVNSGKGESTTDAVYAGHAMVAECGKLLAENKPFCDEEICVCEIDTGLITHERRRINTFANKGAGEYTEVYFSHTFTDTELTRTVDPAPFVPADPCERDARCEEILRVQAAGLAQRMTAAYAKRLVVGISGGLDSTLALLVMIRALDMLGRPHSDVIAVTMPGFGTTGRTKQNATVLCEELGVDFRCVSIHDAVNQHFRDIGHDSAVHDVTYENAQARERTQVIMDIANQVGGLVVGTGDLSELALGWATYNGDHMSMYGVNGGVPKTLVRHLVAHCAETAARDGAEKLAAALADVVDTPVSPELLPADDKGDIAQKTEDLVGPYELHDFFLYHTLRYGETPEKIFRLARHAFADKYDDGVLLHWLETFTRRFFNQQFKRSCLPDGPAVGTVSLSPRAGWRMPSDASSALWLSEINELKEADLS